MRCDICGTKECCGAEAQWELENQVLELKSALASVIQDLRDRASMSRGERVLPLSSGTYLKAMEALGDNT